MPFRRPTPFLRGLLPALCLAIAWVARAAEGDGSPDKSNPPVIADLVARGRESAAKLRTTPHEWTTVFHSRPGFSMRMQRLESPALREWRLDIHGRTQTVAFHITEHQGVWRLVEGDRRVKYRPYEAIFFMGAGYRVMAMADLACVTNEAFLAGATYEGRRDGVVSYRLQPASALSDAMDIAIAGMIKRADLKREALKDRILDNIENGIPISIEESTGMIVGSQVDRSRVVRERFQWRDTADVREPDFGPESGWMDHTRPWSEAVLAGCFIAGYSPDAKPGREPVGLETYLINPFKGEMRRLPYQGMTAAPAVFLENRRDVFAGGYRTTGHEGFLTVDPVSGRNTSQGEAAGFGGIYAGGDLSPDGTRFVTLKLGSRSGPGLHQLHVIDIKSGGVKALGEAGRIGGTFSWLPEGDGVILKRFGQMAEEGDAEPRILCRMDLDGKLTDLRPGDLPVVLRKTRKILYHDIKSGEWHTCELDGSKPRRFGKGFKGHLNPFVSPDEQHIMLSQLEEGKLPQLVIFKLGESKGMPLQTPPGLTSVLSWR